MNPVTVVIPTLNAARRLTACLESLGPGLDVIVADGGSVDETPAIAARHGALVLSAGRGRGVQLAAGAGAATTQWLLFLHADTVLEPRWRDDATAFMAADQALSQAAVFTFALDDPSPQARRLERMVRWRNRALALPYGDQGLLIHRSLYQSVGGYRPLPLMEDVDIIRRIGRKRVSILPARAITSAERWQREGWWRRSARNICCLVLYYAGLPPRHIQKLYGS